MAFASAVLWPAGANAAVTCTFAGNTIAVNASAGTTQVSLLRTGNIDIAVFDGPTTGVPVGGMCAGHTVNDTDTINVTDTNGADALTTLVSLQGGRFEPGLTPDASGIPEIEVFVNNSIAAGDRLQIDGTDIADNLALGEDGAGNVGANLNGDDDGDDVKTTNVGGATEELLVAGRKGDDNIAGIGTGSGFTNPVALNLVQFEGNNGDDRLRGGSGPDQLLGGTQGDNVLGGDGADSVNGGDDKDTLDGGAAADTLEGNAGEDTATYADSTSAVTVTMDGGANDGGAADGSADNVTLGTENVKGGQFGDLLAGSPLANELTGNGGDDTINGLGGQDKPSGSAGDDTLKGGGAADRIFGGDGGDDQNGGRGGDYIKGERGKDEFLGKAGNDKLIAKDGKRDVSISCGKGKNSKEFARRDKKDPKARSC